ncbi:MAG: hypothetical protein ABSF22_21395 [Bryobacteraceae bacterium]
MNMTLTIELPAEIEANLVAKAEAQGLPLPQYVANLLRRQVLSPEERAAAWLESVKGLPHTPPLSDEAISRESLYPDRD